MSRTHDLNVVQRWMQAVITNPDGIVDGVASDAAQQEIALDAATLESFILPSKRCSSIERLSVYGNAYFARLIECLAGEFPALEHALGEQLFADFALTYLQDFPSTSYTLGNLANHFVDFLVNSRPPRDEEEEPQWPDFLIDLSRIESIYSVVFDGPGEENLELISATDLKQIPADKWGEIRFNFVESFRLEVFDFPVHEYVTGVRKEESPEVPSPQKTRLGISRRDYVVRRQSLSQRQFELLTALVEGATLIESIERSIKNLADEGAANFDDFARNLQNWFATWTAAGWFRSLQFD